MWISVAVLRKKVQLLQLQQIHQKKRWSHKNEEMPTHRSDNVDTVKLG